MKFFVDTADVKEIKECQQMGLCDGVTTTHHSSPSRAATSKTSLQRFVLSLKGQSVPK
jgi:hypothetical protein